MYEEHVALNTLVQGKNSKHQEVLNLRDTQALRGSGGLWIYNPQLFLHPEHPLFGSNAGQN